MTHQGNLVKAKDEVIGVTVKNTAREDLGEICEIVLEKTTGQVKYAVLESGGFLGLGGKLFALPWDALHYDLSDESFILDVAKERLKNAPGFDKEHWPDMADRTWSKSIYDYYSDRTEKTF